ncbi:hypothetical protein Tco_0872549 [Tanacetum coccineum]
MFKDDSCKANNVRKDLYEALPNSLELDYSNQRLADQEEARKRRQKRHDAPRSPPRSPPLQPPPPPPPAGASGAPGTSRAAGSSQLPPPPPPSSTGTSGSTPQQGHEASKVQELSPLDDLMHDDSAPDEQVHVYDDQDFGNDHTLAAADSRKDWLDLENNWASALATTYEPPDENSLLANIRDMMTFLNSYCQIMNKTMLTQADFKGKAYEVVKALYPDVIHLHKGSCHALSISKMKAAGYPDFGLELLVPEQMWIDDVCTYDVTAKYGISHWWFTRQKFYIDRHDSLSRQKEVRTHIQILSVVRIKAYSRYGYDYLSEIVLRRADHEEHTIAKKDFKNLYPSDFKDLNLLLLQGHLDHLSGSDKQMLSTAIKLWTRNLVIRQRVEDFQLGYKFKHYYTIIKSPRAIIFLVNNNERKIMRFNKIYKFSDGTLTRILETLDYRVKEFKIERLNPEGSTGTWNALLVDVFVILTTAFFRELNDIVIPSKSDALDTYSVTTVLQSQGIKDQQYQSWGCFWHTQALTKPITHIEGWKGNFFFIENKIIPSKYSELLPECNKLDKKSFKDVIPLHARNDPLYHQISTYPCNVRTFPDPILYLADLKFSWKYSPKKPIIYHRGIDMDFRSFMMEGIDGEFHFEPEGGIGDGEGSSPSTRFVNNETLVIDVDPLNFAPPSKVFENIRDSNDASLEKDVADEAEKLRKVPPQASKVVGDASDTLDVDSDPNIHEFPSAKEPKDSVDCHWVVAHITPPS